MGGVGAGTGLDVFLHLTALKTMKTEKPRVLLVEDNRADANLIEEAMAEANLDCEVSIMRNGAQAIEFI